jgi:hypothetical protein
MTHANPRPRIVGAFLAASLVLAVSATGRSQTPGTSAPPARGQIAATPAAMIQPVPDNSAQVAPGQEPSGAAGNERAWSGPPGTTGGGERGWSGPPGEGPKTFWETVPPVTPYPRPGNFYVAPSGPGYYTLLDLLRDRELQDRPHDPYLQWGQNPNPFFNVDFRYLDNPNNTETDFLDPLKRIHLGDDWLLSLGGEIRNRYAQIDNALLFNKNKVQAGNDDRYDLFRARLYEDLWYRDIFRLYGEFISADSSAQSVPRSNSDVDKADILNLFAEIKLFDIDEHGLYLRGGRQELLFGSQRLISPSDWSNDLRTFQGVRATWHNEDVEFDLFWTQPVIVNSGQFDSVDDKQQFFGNWWKYRLTKDTSIDLYYLNLDNNNHGVATGQYKATGGYDVNTIGIRFVGQQDRFLWDFEDAFQFGEWVNQQICSGMSVTGIGWWFKSLPAEPTVWLYYDYASGDPHPGVGDVHRTFDPLFPFGHQYFDSLDAIGRENINDAHIDTAFFPVPWMRLTFAYHNLTLESAKDALYNTTGSVVRSDPTGKSGTDVGNGISASAQFHIDNHEVLNVSYGHLFAGSFLDKTAIDANGKKDLDAIWVQYTFKW